MILCLSPLEILTYVIPSFISYVSIDHNKFVATASDSSWKWALIVDIWKLKKLFQDLFPTWALVVLRLKPIHKSYVLGWSHSMTLFFFLVYLAKKSSNFISVSNLDMTDSWFHLPTYFKFDSSFYCSFSQTILKRGMWNLTVCLPLVRFLSFRTLFFW